MLIHPVRGYFLGVVEITQLCGRRQGNGGFELPMQLIGRPCFAGASYLAVAPL